MVSRLASLTNNSRNWAQIKAQIPRTMSGGCHRIGVSCSESHIILGSIRGTAFFFDISISYKFGPQSAYVGAISESVYIICCI